MCHSEHDRTVSETKLDVCAVVSGLHQPCLLAVYIETAIMELIHVVIKEDVQPHVEWNIIAEII